MNIKHPTVLMIAISLMAAVGIFFGSDLIPGNNSDMTVVYWIIAVWWIPFSFLVNKAAKNGTQDKNSN
ncbi:MAG: hypothetical protein AAF490_19385 [Chloroflexota bacterium]